MDALAWPATRLAEATRAAIVGTEEGIMMSLGDAFQSAKPRVGSLEL